MSADQTLLTAEEREAIRETALVRPQLQEQFRDPAQQHEAASLGMWVFLATEVLFFGVLFLGVNVYRYYYAEAFEAASGRLNWLIGGVNTIVLLVSSLTMVLAVHYSRHGLGKRTAVFLGLTALLGIAFLGFKGLEYYIDYVEYLIPGWRFEPEEWVAAGLRPDQVPHVRLFLSFYWIMTSLHALHVTIGIVIVLILAVLAWQGRFGPDYYSPVDATGLYWHFVDIVWIFLLPTLYLMGTHHW